MERAFLDVYKRQVLSHSNDEKDNKGRYVRRETFSGSCARSFYVGEVKKEDIHAKFEDGVLPVSYTHLDVYKRQIQIQQAVADEIALVAVQDLFHQRL